MESIKLRYRPETTIVHMPYGKSPPPKTLEAIHAMLRYSLIPFFERRAHGLSKANPRAREGKIKMLAAKRTWYQTSKSQKFKVAVCAAECRARATGRRIQPALRVIPTRYDAE